MMRVIRSVISSVYINTEKGLFVLIHSPRKSITGLSQQTGLNYQSLQWCVEHLKPVLSDSYGEWTVCVLILLQDWRIHINHIPGSTLFCVSKHDMNKFVSEKWKMSFSILCDCSHLWWTGIIQKNPDLRFLNLWFTNISGTFLWSQPTLHNA